MEVFAEQGRGDRFSKIMDQANKIKELDPSLSMEEAVDQAERFWNRLNG